MFLLKVKGVSIHIPLTEEADNHYSYLVDAQLSQVILRRKAPRHKHDTFSLFTVLPTKLPVQHSFQNLGGEGLPALL
jgi:hypothetical protein